MTVREEKISLHLWNYYRSEHGAHVQRMSYIFGSAGKVLSVFQRGVASYLHLAPLEIRMAYNRCESDIMIRALDHGDRRIAREEDALRWEWEQEELMILPGEVYNA